MNPQQAAILKEAEKRNIEIEDISIDDETEAHLLSTGSDTELVIDGTPRGLVNPEAEQNFDDKQRTKHKLASLKIPVPEGVVFTGKNIRKAGKTLNNSSSFVCKPLDLTDGEGVHLNIVTLRDLEDYFERYNDLSERFLLEKKVEGSDLRIQVLGGKIIAACTRKPANVVGDGVSSISQLIAQKNQTIQELNPLNHIVPDQETIRLLKHQNFELTSVPPSGRVISLKEIANMSQGATAHDLTSQIHPDYHDWVSKIASGFKSEYFAIDLMSTDPTAPPSEASHVIEINARPMWLHHTFSDGKKHDIAKSLLDHLFPG